LSASCQFIKQKDGENQRGKKELRLHTVQKETTMTPISVYVAVVAVIGGIFVSSNRMLFGLSTGNLSEEDYAAFVTTKDDVLDYYLEKHHKQIGDDFQAYRHHCLRVLSFAKYFLSLENIDFASLEPRVHNDIVMALAYHDIALWTDGKLNYLTPSVIQMNNRVLEEMKLSKQSETDEAAIYIPMRYHWSTFEEDSVVASAIIMEHHKLTNYDYHTSKNNINSSDGKPVVENINEIVNAVRKADWADATMGLIRFGLPQSLLGAAYEAIPDEGFHNVLLNMGARLSPNSLKGQLEVLKILKW
jgi:hypothetical protein